MQWGSDFWEDGRREGKLATPRLSWSLTSSQAFQGISTKRCTGRFPREVTVRSVRRAFALRDRIGTSSFLCLKIWSRTTFWFETDEEGRVSSRFKSQRQSYHSKCRTWSRIWKEITTMNCIEMARRRLQCSLTSKHQWLRKRISGLPRGSWYANGRRQSHW